MRSFTGVTAICFFLIPITTADDGSITSTSPKTKKKNQQILYIEVEKIDKPSWQLFFKTSSIKLLALIPNLIPKVLSNGDGTPP